MTISGRWVWKKELTADWFLRSSCERSGVRRREEEEGLSRRHGGTEEEVGEEWSCEEEGVGEGGVVSARMRALPTMPRWPAMKIDLEERGTTNGC
jgi:hypothetical protein